MDLKSLIKWSQKEFGYLPWRIDRSLYRTLVSEIMLQQTTVGTVRNHFERFIREFPDLKSLARASEQELLVAWKGLGYYRRARDLKKIAETLTKEYQGEFPLTREELMNIPGIGPYTANALIAIGMDRRALAVDANLERVIARLFHLRLPKGIKLQNEIYQLFSTKKIFATKVSSRALNEALMDLGRTYCQARKASCDLCPLSKKCLSFKRGNPASIPMREIPENKKRKMDELHLLRVLVIKGNEILVYKKNDKQWLAGQYEIPTLILSTTDGQLKQYPRFNKDFNIKPLFSFKTAITKYKIQNSVVVLGAKEIKKLSFKAKVEWRPLFSKQSNLSTATLKAIEGWKKTEIRNKPDSVLNYHSSRP